MTKLRRFIPSYGGKRSIAHLYPVPRYRTIIEPFAGGAGYSLEYPDRNIMLWDLDERVVGVWNYLIHASEQDVLSIPADCRDVDELPARFGQEVKWLVGWWMQPAGSSGPAKKVSSWAHQHAERSDVWGEKCRARLASQLHAIRHWHAYLGSWEEILVDRRPGYSVHWSPHEATWFVDPPYQAMGVHYKQSSRNIDFDKLALWCQQLPGQAIVCENEGATWLPFEPLCDMVGGAMKRTRKEVVYVHG